MLRAADTGSVPAAGASADLLVVLSLVAGSVAAMEVAVGAAAASAGGDSATASEAAPPSGLGAASESAGVDVAPAGAGDAAQCQRRR